MNEFELIAKLTKSLPTNKNVLCGAGDDCAVLDFGLPDKLFLFKTDAVVEGVHFTKDTPPEKIGRKALARCLSDIAAMAGTPGAALVTLGLPSRDGGIDAGFVSRIYDGMSAIAKKFGVAIVGGETTTNPDRIFLSIALLGTVARGKQVLRSGAKTGDAIFVTGELGGSIAGKHLEFEPRIAEAQWLSEHFPVHAMIDLSDGLAGDLRHILDASGVGAELLKTAVPVSAAAKKMSRSRRGQEAEMTGIEPGPPPHVHPSQHCYGGQAGGYKLPIIAALTDGEDFELLFTVAGKDAVTVLDAWKKQFPGLKLSCIGKIVKGAGITVRDKTASYKLNAHGYVHFAK